MNHLDLLVEQIPDYAKDLRLNLSSVLRQTELTPVQIWGTALASAYAARNTQLLQAVTKDAAAHLSPQQLDAARAAAAIMSMNNIYYRFHHLTPNEKYATIPARLRMNVIRTHGTDQVDFELFSTAVSAINGCGKCVSAHEAQLKQHNVSEETINAAIRIAAVMHGVATVLDAQTVVTESVTA